MSQLNRIFIAHILYVNNVLDGDGGEGESRIDMTQNFEKFIYSKNK